MISKTKFHLDKEMITRLFSKADITDVREIAPLGAGEYNAVYAVETGSGTYVLKIAPPPEVKVLTYEQNLMKSEVFWYEQISQNTTVRVPKVYYSDFSKEMIPAGYFIMEKLNGKQLNEMDFTPKEWDISIANKAQMAAQIHKISANGYGYLQNGLKDTWYQAIYSMVKALVDDCHALSKETPDGEKLLQYIDKYRSILEKVESVMVNFDLWDSNVLCERENGELHFSWIDPERSFWGDPIADFVSMGRDSTQPLSLKKDSLEAYNQVAKSPVQGTKEENIRYAVALGYLALIQETEKYVRYEPGDQGWNQSVHDAQCRYGAAFSILENEGRV